MVYTSKQEYKARRQSKNVADGKTTNTRKGNYGKSGGKKKDNPGHGGMGKSMGKMKYGGGKMGMKGGYKKGYKK